MYYIIPIDEREKPKFDAYLEGILFDNSGELALNLFISGNSVIHKASNSYKIQADAFFSEIGKIRDRLVTKAHKSPLLVVSKKFKELLCEVEPSSAEFYPLEVDYVNSKPLSDYYICNLLKKYDCINYEDSIINFEYYNDENEGFGRIFSIESLVIDESKIYNKSNLFLLDNLKTPVIVASESFRKEIISRNITGFKFIEPINFMV